MGKPVISLEKVSKQYTLFHQQEANQSFREMLAGTVRNRFRKRIRKEQRETFWALRDIDLTVTSGSCLGIIGRNGAGKSTLLKILSRITMQSTGRVTLCGRVGSLLEVGTGFHGDLTGRENVFLNGSILGMKQHEIRNKFDEIVSFAEVETFLDTPVKYYSSGMYMRLAFSVAAHLEPEILIIDEVLAVGDQRFQQKCLGKMENISKEHGRTILFVSHKLDAIHALCDRAIVLDKGELVYDSTPKESIAHYLQNANQSYDARFDADPDKPSITSVVVDRTALGHSQLRLTIDYASPFVLGKVIPGFVLYNVLNAPVLGSNPRYHSDNFEPGPAKSGSCTAVINDLELHSGTYKISVWLGDHYDDYDVKHEALMFEYENPNNYVHMPDPLLIGSVDKTCTWQWQSQ